MIKGWVVSQWPHTRWRARETSGCSVQEAESFRSRRTYYSARVGAKGLVTSWRVNGVSSHSKAKKTGVWYPRVMAAAKNTPAQESKLAWIGKLSPLVSVQWFQPAERRCPHSGWVFPHGFAGLHANHLWKHAYRNNQKCALPVFQVSIQLNLSITIKHHIVSRCLTGVLDINPLILRLFSHLRSEDWSLLMK
jgi:hypothetical protein